MLWAIYCVDRQGGAPLRSKLRAAHLEYLGGFKHKILLGGATLSDDGATMTGSVIVVNMDSRAAAEEFSANDPFAKGGLFESVAIKRMRQALFNAAAAQ